MTQKTETYSVIIDSVHIDPQTAITYVFGRVKENGYEVQLVINPQEIEHPPGTDILENVQSFAEKKFPVGGVVPLINHI